MAVYFDHRVQAPVPGQNTDVAWHSTHSTLAVLSYSDMNGGSVQLYSEEGEHAADTKMRKSRPATAVMWHPSRRVLAVGWETGEVTVWNDSEKEMYDGAMTHHAEVTVLHWTSSGSRLLSGDAHGLVILWKADSRGRLQHVPLFQQNLEEQLTHCVLRPQAALDPANDLSSLARAAVSGDENALDMFNWKKGGSKGGNMQLSASSMGQEATCFFIGGKNGSVYYLDENLKLTVAVMAETAVRKLLFYEPKNCLITVTTNMMLTQHSITPEGVATEMLKVKLSGKSDNPDTIWAGIGVLAMCTGESVLRMWDLEKEENYILNLEGHTGYDHTELITCVAHCQNTGVLAGATGAGKVAMWKWSPMSGAGATKQEPEDKWKLQPPSMVGGSATDLNWGSSKNLLAVNTVDEVYILSQQVMSQHYSEEMAVVQTSPMQLAISIFSADSHHDLKTDIQIKGVHTTKESVAVWDAKKLVVYEISPDNAASVRATGTFTTDSTTCCLFQQNVYTMEPGKIQVRTPQGTVKQILGFSEAEGDPVCMEVCGHHLVSASANGVIKVYDLSRREAKPVSTPKHLGDSVREFGSIRTVMSNCNGSRVSAMVTKADGKLDPKLYVWDMDMDTITYFNFASGRGEQDEYVASSSPEAEEDITDAERGKRQAARDIAGRCPVNHHWDAEEPKLLICEAQIQTQPSDQREKDKEDWRWGGGEDDHRSISLTKATMDTTVEVMVVSLFVTQEQGLLIQDNFPMSSAYNGLIGVQVPFYYFTTKAEEQQAGSSGKASRPVERRVMRDFVGLEMADKNSRDAMMNFSFYLTIGDMDEAFKAIKLIKSESVWENMAQMCVKNRRLDVASVCLGNMSSARGAKALRESLKENDLDARVAILAMQLGLTEDAERLLKNCKRYDLLNEFYQGSGQWGKAMETAEMYDRIHLRTTYYNYARHLESKGDINGAIPNYEKSDTHRFEVPRMLSDEPQMLETYIMKTKDRALRKWWAQYMESTSEMETALQFYESAQDYLSLVRVYCYCGKIDKATEICNETGDKAACYHLARQYENSDDVRQAIHFFTRAGAYGNAIRLCREHGLEDQLMNLALLSRPHEMVEAARHYETRSGCQDKAVLLYHKAGYFSKALELAFETRQFAALQMVSEDLDERTDPELLQRCADFFTDNGQFDRAVDLLAVGKKHWDALKICMEQHVPMTEELVEKLTPSKSIAEDERNRLLEGIAEVCMQQRQYHLATKKYTQSGNKAKAMKALLKSGDTDKIVFFAGVSRQKEIYVMAAHYLQTLDWRKDPEIMKNIISFYTKGRALDSLASFYDACGQVEIDEYQNYDKALGALAEAYKCLSKAKVANESQKEDKMVSLRARMTIIKKFVQARSLYEDDPMQAVKQCEVLLEETNVDSAVRIGDIYAFLAEHHARKQAWKPAYRCLEDLKAHMPRGASITYYVNQKTVEAIYRGMDIPLKGVAPVNGVKPGNDAEEEEGEEVEEDVVDEIYDD